ncbi:phage holin family protein [Iocasia frigidifontis]|uniref:Phage holin family protein n=1 Tax=Iocasia fonsfrigidae TaxID=2682810 RepID=A0A8A7KDC4_9FIRM|nr:phage holin family protein [Iocasia fonsfrigidae]QTL99786.1 phage holin family protein [Iocasia fonsfrigidae]
MQRKTFAAKLLITMVALMITAYIVPGIYVSGFIAGLLAALILGFVNAVFKPIFTILTLPFTIITFGLFLFVINGLMLLITAAFVPGFYISGIFSAIIASIILSFINWILEGILD